MTKEVACLVAGAPRDREQVGAPDLPNTVWRDWPTRPRPGKPAKYDETTVRRILAQLDQPPPDGYTTWTGGLVAKALGDRSGASCVAGLSEATGFTCSGSAAGA